MTKREKRKRKEQDRGIVDFMMVTNHFFHSLRDWIGEMKDPRNQAYITYSQTDLTYMGIVKNICGQHSMREMEENFNQTNCIETLRIMSGNGKLQEMPHYDTLNYYLEKLAPECLDGLRKKMVTSLIRGKYFNRGRLFGKYWRIILDGTGLHYFKEKHCDNCLCTTRKLEDGKTVKMYYHKVLEAKIVLSDNVVISVGTEFIENENEDVSKQDCELNAAKRLMEKIKKDYPRLPICIQGDALYTTESIMQISREYHWEYLLTQKDGRQKVLDESFEWIKSGNGTETQSGLCEEKGTACYANHVEEVAGKKEVMNVFEYEYETRDKQRKKHTTRFRWVCSMELTKRNIEELILAGRGRWKIENEGFNNQKNGLYRIEHLNSHNSNAMKNHYLLTQIADILMQLYLAWNPYIRELKQTIKNTSSWLLESFRGLTVTEEDVSYIFRHTAVYLK
ncbi:MAG: transposase family protein [Lachnospiraceae bacterium]|nr:transposase family protein [Lachnospiraceae bacterium]